MSHQLPPALHRLLPFWVDNKGAAHYRGKLRAAEHTRMTSFADHLFKVTDERTNTLHYFIAGAKAGSAVISLQERIRMDRT